MSSSAVGFPQKSHLRLLSSSDCQFLYFRLCLITNIIRWNKLLSRSAPCVPNPPGQGGYQTLNLSSQYPVLCSAVDNCWANKITPPIQSVSRPIYKFSRILLSRRGGLDLSKEVLWVSVGQLATKLQAVKVIG